MAKPLKARMVVNTFIAPMAKKATMADITISGFAVECPECGATCRTVRGEWILTIEDLDDGRAYCSECAKYFRLPKRFLKMLNMT